MSERRICDKVLSHVWGTRCKKSGNYEHDGRFYCAQHHPPTVADKRKARQERYIAEAKARNLIRNREAEIAEAKERVVEAAKAWEQYWGVKRPFKIDSELCDAVQRLEAAERGE